MLLSPRKYGLDSLFSGSGKRGVEFKKGSLNDGFGNFNCFGGSGKHLALLCLTTHTPLIEGVEVHHLN